MWWHFAWIKARTVGIGWGTQLNEILWHRTKGDAECKTQGNGNQVETIRDQGRHQTSVT